jgi:hypothetical protein
LYALAYARAGRQFVKGKELLLIWAVVPLLLSYAYTVGVQWRRVRWIHFIPQSLAVLTGVGFTYSDRKKIVAIALALLSTIQLISTIQTYHFDILTYLAQ